jgi:hypothetical protein
MNPKNNYINTISKLKPGIIGMSGSLNIPQKQTASVTQPTAKPKTYLESANNPSVATNTAATSPALAKTATPTLPPAGQQFVNNLVTKPNTPSSVAQNNPQQPTQTQTTTPTQPESPYLKYLNSLFDPSKVNDAFTKSTEANKRLADIQSRNERQNLDSIAGREQILTTPGGLKGGAEQSAGVFSRKANVESAYGAIEESAAARTASVYKDTFDTLIGAGKSVFEAETEAKKAAQDQSNKDREQKLAEDKFEEDKRQFGEEIALKRYESSKPKALTAAQEAKQIADQEKEVATQQSASQSLGIINNLLSDDKYKSITGAAQSPLSYIGLGAGVREYNQLKSQLALGARSLLKGSGAVSDYEAKVLQDSTSALGRELDNDSFKQALLTVRGVIKTNNGQVTPVQVTNPATGETVNTELSGAEIYQLNSEGNLITYK